MTMKMVIEPFAWRCSAPVLVFGSGFVTNMDGYHTDFDFDTEFLAEQSAPQQGTGSGPSPSSSSGRPEPPKSSGQNGTPPSSTPPSGGQRAPAPPVPVPNGSPTLPNHTLGGQRPPMPNGSSPSPAPTSGGQEPPKPASGPSSTSSTGAHTGPAPNIPPPKAGEGVAPVATETPTVPGNCSVGHGPGCQESSIVLFVCFPFPGHWRQDTSRITHDFFSFLFFLFFFLLLLVSLCSLQPTLSRSTTLDPSLLFPRHQMQRMIWTTCSSLTLAWTC